MKKWAHLVAAILVLVLWVSGSDKPWTGTYAMEINPDNKETYEMFVEMDMLWPEITLKEDGTFLLQKTEGNMKIAGTYTVEGSTLTINAKEVDGNPPEGAYTKPYSTEFKDEFKILMFEGPDKDKWVKKEINEAFLKK